MKLRSDSDTLCSPLTASIASNIFNIFNIFNTLPSSVGGTAMQAMHVIDAYEVPREELSARHAQHLDSTNPSMVR